MVPNFICQSYKLCVPQAYTLNNMLFREKWYPFCSQKETAVTPTT
jgi:hypothetical protein